MELQRVSCSKLAFLLLVLVGLWSCGSSQASINETIDAETNSTCKGKCVHVFMGLLCEHVDEEADCDASYLRCCIGGMFNEKASRKQNFSADSGRAGNDPEMAKDENEVVKEKPSSNEVCCEAHNVTTESIETFNNTEAPEIFSMTPSSIAQAHHLVVFTCPGSCVVPLFGLFCDRVAANETCPYGRVCCTSPAISLANSEVQNCSGRCLPTFLGSMCKRPPDAPYIKTNCPIGTVCCSQEEIYEEPDNNDDDDDKDTTKDSSELLVQESKPTKDTIPPPSAALQWTRPLFQTLIKTLQNPSFFSSPEKKQSTQKPMLIPIPRPGNNKVPPKPQRKKPFGTAVLPKPVPSLEYLSEEVKSSEEHEDDENVEGDLSSFKPPKKNLFMMKPDKMWSPVRPAPHFNQRRHPTKFPSRQTQLTKPPSTHLFHNQKDPYITSESIQSSTVFSAPATSGWIPNGFGYMKTPETKIKVLPESLLNQSHFMPVTNMPYTSVKNSLPTTRKPESSSCGVKGLNARKHSPRVVDGKESFPGEWCWHAALVNSNNQYICGGAVIGPQWILTAAHCVTNYTGNETSLYVKLGYHDLTSRYNIPGAQTKTVASVYVHHNHNPETLDNDIALLKLQDFVQLNDAVCLVCLPSKSSTVNPGTKCTITGYGSTTEDGSMAFRLRETVVPLVDDEVCKEKLTNITGKDFALPNGSFCAGEGDGDACKGDGGGPLVCKTDGFYELTGVISWGLGCGRSESPGVYTNVSMFTGWLNQIINVNRF